VFLATCFTSSFVFARLQSAFTFFQPDALAFSICGIGGQAQRQNLRKVSLMELVCNLLIAKLRLVFPACVSLPVSLFLSQSVK
jgi:hypothetical protein